MRAVLCSLIMCWAAAFPAAAQQLDVQLYRDHDYGFAAIFPERPMARDVAYATREGASVQARQFYVENGATHYLVTVMTLPDGPAIDFDAVEFAAENIRRMGEVRLEFDMAYDPGIPGRQLVILTPEGMQTRSSIYMWDHNLYVAEALAAPGDAAALKLEQSLLLLDEAGDPVDTGSGNCPVRPE